MALGFIRMTKRGGDRQSARKTEVVSFHNLISEVTPHHFCNIILIRIMSLELAPSEWEGITQGYDYQTVGITGGTF